MREAEHDEGQDTVRGAGHGVGGQNTVRGQKTVRGAEHGEGGRTR